MKLITLILMATISSSAGAGVFKCEKNGAVVYMETPCDGKREKNENKEPVSKAPPAPYRSVLEPPVDCSFQESEVKSAKRAMKNWYPASMSEALHQRVRMTEHNLAICKSQQDF